MSLSQSLRDTVLNNLSRSFGRKIVVIESDDWGSIRMPSASVYRELLREGYPIDKCAYNRFDTLESDSDMTALFDVLQTVHDIHGKPAVITANWIAANPDFDKMRASDFKEYAWEESTATMMRYPGRERVLSLQKKGLEQSVFFPQFHGREHVHVTPWMVGVSNKESAIRKAFDRQMISFNTQEVPSCEGDFMDVCNAKSQQDLSFSVNALQEGLRIFESTWGYTSKTAIPPCYYWHADHEKILAEGGVELIQGIAVQKCPNIKKGKWTKKYHWTGQKNAAGQFYSRRNVFFEPSLLGTNDLVNRTLAAIDKLFAKGQAAIISSHRLNFVGGIDPMNRDNNLKELSGFLKKLTAKHPDVEFMHSAALLELLKAKN